MAVLGGRYEERVGAVKVLAVLDGAEPFGVVVGEKVLRGGVPAVREAFEEAGGLADEVIALLEGFLDLDALPLVWTGMGSDFDASIMKTANPNWISGSGSSWRWHGKGGGCARARAGRAGPPDCQDRGASDRGVHQRATVAGHYGFAAGMAVDAWTAGKKLSPVFVVFLGVIMGLRARIAILRLGRLARATVLRLGILGRIIQEPL